MKNPVQAELDDLAKQLAQANRALEQHCGCLFTSGMFHKRTCPFHERLFKDLREAKDQVAFLSQKR